MNKQNKTPNKFLAPVVIAGVTIGFLASAYKFIFAKPDQLAKSAINAPQSSPEEVDVQTPSQSPQE